MSTKAFTSALGYGVTIRGYIDEDDKLVLLEPEGSGGGELRTANVSITNNSEKQVIFPIVDSDGRVSASDIIDDDNDFTVPMSESGAIIKIEQPDAVNVTLTGDIEAVTGTPYLLVTGDGTVTIGGK